MADTSTIASTVIPESGIWPEGIYCIQTTDRALGYNATTKQDGPSNRQWIQLANRTRYLRELFTRTHDDDGHHLLTDVDFNLAAGITEDHIDLAYATSDIKSELASIQSSVTDYLNTIESGELSEGELLYAWAIQKLVPLAWEYGGNAYAFEMFTESMTLTNTSAVAVTRAVTGDDSLDVTSTSGLSSGQVFYLTNDDGTEVQQVVIDEILSEVRVTITEDATFSISNDGWLRGTNVTPITLGTEADSDFYYISDYISTFVDYGESTLVIRRSGGEPETKSVVLVGESGTEYEAVLQYTQDFDEYVEDRYIVPAISEPFMLKVTYTGFTETATFIMFYLYTDTVYESIDTIHRPTIESYTQNDDGTWTVTGDYYGTLYGIPQVGIDAQTSPYYDFSTISNSFSEDGAVQEIAITLDETSYVRIRYSDDEGIASPWSNPVRITIEEE